MANLILKSLSSSNRIKRELTYGDAYRNYKNNIAMPPLYPVRSPMDITHVVHHKKRDVRTVQERATSPPTRKGCNSKSVPHIKNSYWERAMLSHKQYTDMLSTPHLQSCGDHEGVKKNRSQTAPTICSPRLAQMACPTKRRILGVWQSYGELLPLDALHRLHDMLYTSQNVDMKEARNFFKICDRKKRRLKRKLKLRKKRRKNKLKAYWLRDQVEETAKAILNYFTREATLDPSFKQLLLSDVLLVVLAKITKKNDPISRYNSNQYSKELVKVVDKMAIWIDGVSKIVEIQGLEDEEEEGDIAAKGSEVASSEISSSIISEIGSEGDAAGGLGGSRGQGRPGGPGQGRPGGPGQGVGAGQGEGGFGRVSSLQRLIQILAHASSGYLAGTVEDFENLTRNELLNKIKVLNKEYTGAETPAELLKKILMEWAMHSDPSKIDLQIVKKIEVVADMLAAMLAAEDVYGMMGLTPGDLKGTGLPGVKGAGLPGVKESAGKPASELMEVIDFGEDGEPLPGTLTEVIAADGSVQMGVVDETGEVMPVQVTPSGNLVATVYDKNGKVVDKLFDNDGNLLDVTFNKFGVPEPNTYNGELFDDVKYAHELIYNAKGNIIPLCYDKDGNPIGAGLDADGNPLFYGPDGKLISVPPGGFAKMVNGKLVIIGPDGEPIAGAEEEAEKEAGEQEGEEETEEAGEAAAAAAGEAEGEVETEEEVKKEMEAMGGMGEDEEEETEEEEEESSVESEEGKKSGEEKEGASPTGSRESMITVIKGHKPKKVYEHSKNTVCCLSLKIWAVWLLEITHNAHNWTKWISNIISQIREFAAILRGEVLLPSGQKKVLFKDDWNKFVEDMNEDIIAWRQYSRHVNDLTKTIIEKFHGKKVYCCEKCLQDHLIKNVVTAHDTMRALTEALNCAGYWQRCLDEIVQATSKLVTVKPDADLWSSDEETGWSYSVSSDDDNGNNYCYNKRRKPSIAWKKMKESPCPCPCKLRQLFPKDEGCACATTSRRYCM